MIPSHKRLSSGLAGLLWLSSLSGTSAEEGVALPAEPVGAVAPSPPENGSEPPARTERQEQDLQDVEALQMQSLHAQQGQDSASVRRQNGFTGWLDKTHQPCVAG
jgi:hypothetical protein